MLTRPHRVTFLAPTLVLAEREANLPAPLATAAQAFVDEPVGIEPHSGLERGLKTHELTGCAREGRDDAAPPVAQGAPGRIGAPTPLG